VSPEELEKQQKFLETHFLLLPTQVMISHVNDLSTLQDAEDYLLQHAAEDGSYLHKFLGVDAEWKTTMATKSKRGRDNDDDEFDEVEPKSGGSEGGASILQV
jgi:hypothetical protein